MSHNLVAIGVDELGPVNSERCVKLPTIPCVHLKAHFERVVVLDCGPGVVLRELVCCEFLFNQLCISREGHQGGGKGESESLHL